MPKLKAYNDFDRSDLKLGSEHVRAKKTAEEMDLQYFLAAYARTNLGSIYCLESSERPDFICARSDGSTVGLELVKVTRDPTSRWADEAFFHREHMDAGQAFWRISESIAAKESKRQQPDWKLKDNAILVVQTMDCPLMLLDTELEPELFRDHGFEEVWLADYCELEKYGSVELFCLYPTDLWGWYSSERGKPYG
jgi:hypothetical protein